MENITLDSTQQIPDNPSETIRETRRTPLSSQLGMFRHSIWWIWAGQIDSKLGLQRPNRIKSATDRNICQSLSES